MEVVNNFEGKIVEVLEIVEKVLKQFELLEKLWKWLRNC